MNMNPRDPLHRSRSNQPEIAPQKVRPSEIPVPATPKLNTPDYGDKPEQVPQVEGGLKDRRSQPAKK